jgi:hypothetical protein
MVALPVQTSGGGNIHDTVTMPSGAKTLTRRREKSAHPLRAGVTDSNPANNSATDTDTLY